MTTDINKQRRDEAATLRHLYLKAEVALAEAGKYLRTTEAGRYLWANSHRNAITGMKSLLKVLSRDVPY